MRDMRTSMLLPFSRASAQPPRSTAQQQPRWSAPPRSQPAPAPRCPQNNEGREAEGPGEVKNAYEFTLEHIGNDMHAGLLWQEYIGFLQNCRPGSATYTALYGAGMDESQRTTTLRWAAGGWGVPS